MSDPELRRARGMLDVAEAIPPAPERFGAALLAAQVIAALILRVRTARVLPAQRNVWQLVLTASPELGEWAGVFAACQVKHRDAPAAITAREADDLVRDVRCFHDVVAAWQARNAEQEHHRHSGAPA